MTKPVFRNPYETLNESQTSRVNADIPTEDYQMLQRMRVVRGTIQTTTNILLEKLFNELKRLGLVDYTKAADFEDYIVHIKLVDGRPSRGGGTAIRSGEETDERDDGRRTAPTGDPNTAASHVASDVPIRRGGGKRRVETRRS